MRSVKTTLLLRARLPAGSMVVVISISVSAPKGWDQRGSALAFQSVARALKGLGPGPRFSETRWNAPHQGSRKTLVLKGFLSFGGFHRIPKYRRVVLTPRRWRQVLRRRFRPDRVAMRQPARR